MTEPHAVAMFPGSSVVMLLVRQGGGSDAQGFIRSLDKRYRARFKRYFERLRDGIPVQSPEHIRRLSHTGTEPLVFELKVDKFRLYIVRSNNRWYASHGRSKPKDNQVTGEVQKALAAFWRGNGEI